MAVLSISVSRGIPRIPHSQIARSAIMNRGNQINLWYVLFAVMGVVLLRDIWVQTQTVESIPYSQFESYLERDVIEKVEIGSTSIRGTFKVAQDGKTGFITTPVAPDLAERS